jgi:hypothetical protein
MLIVLPWGWWCPPSLVWRALAGWRRPSNGERRALGLPSRHWCLFALVVPACGRECNARPAWQAGGSSLVPRLLLVSWRAACAWELTRYPSIPKSDKPLICSVSGSISGDRAPPAAGSDAFAQRSALFQKPRAWSGQAGLVPLVPVACIEAMRCTYRLTVTCYPVRAQPLGDSSISFSKTRSRAAACARQTAAPTSRTPFRCRRSDRPPRQQHPVHMRRSPASPAAHQQVPGTRHTLGFCQPRSPRAGARSPASRRARLEGVGLAPEALRRAQPRRARARHSPRCSARERNTREK